MTPAILPIVKNSPNAIELTRARAHPCEKNKAWCVSDNKKLREALLIVYQSITVTVINLYGSDSVSKEASSCIYNITLHNYTDLPVWQREQPDQQWFRILSPSASSWGREASSNPEHRDGDHYSLFAHLIQYQYQPFPTATILSLFLFNLQLCLYATAIHLSYESCDVLYSV